jgi:AcrR family transcriptional regulator
MQILEPRKIPRQGRSRATVDAILDAAAEGIAGRGYAALTTNAISERAGVSIGTLYEYFPNREAIAASLASRAFLRTEAAMRKALQECVAWALPRFEGAEHMLFSGLKVLMAERAVFRELMVQAPFILQLPVVREARNALIGLSQEVREVSHGLLLPMPQSDAWLIAQMLSAAMLEIVCLDTTEEDRRRLTRELARLTYRMALARDPSVTAPWPGRSEPAERRHPGPFASMTPASPNSFDDTGSCGDDWLSFGSREGR